MKSRLASSVLIVMTILLASCASLLGPREMEIPVASLQNAIAERFPFNNRYLQLLDVSVTNPRVSMLPESNRILTSMDTSVAPPFLKKTWNGNLAISGRLHFDPASNSLVLAEPRVETFQVHGLDPLYANRITAIGSLLAEQLFQNIPLYTFDPDAFRYAGASFLPTKITTRENGLVVTFEPAK